GLYLDKILPSDFTPSIFLFVDDANLSALAIFSLNQSQIIDLSILIRLISRKIFALGRLVDLKLQKLEKKSKNKKCTIAKIFRNPQKFSKVSKKHSKVSISIKWP